MSACCTPAARAIEPRRAPSNPFAANSASAASRMRFCVSAGLRTCFLGFGKRFEVEHAEIGKTRSNARREKPEALHIRHDLREKKRPEEVHHLALVCRGFALRA